jgi:nitroimidazol reductase NimA-like FMN-containing flavoprotein (pyridoxamine 5'-phosphate oxidase superfamily)
MASAIPSNALRRHPERSVPDEIADIVLRGHVAHVGIVDDGMPVVIPMTYGFDPANPNVVYIHGAPVARILAGAADGAPACVTVTELNGLVASKTALNHSMVYRSAIGFGRMREVADAVVKAEVLRSMIGRYFPGRAEGRDFSRATDAHLVATKLVAIDVEAWSAKARKHGPSGPGDDDPEVPGTCGIVEISPS